MKNTLIFTFSIIAILATMNQCKEKEKESDEIAPYGSLVFKGIKSELPQKFISPYNSEMELKYKTNTAWMHTLNLKLNVREIWVSQSEVAEGVRDTFGWVKIGEGNELKFFDEYYFENNRLATGEYKSIKIIFNELFYRQACFASDTSQIVMMKERMGDWIDTVLPPCADMNKTAPVNYFSQYGNFILQESNGAFKLVNANEKLTGFTIRPEQQTTLYWKMGDERPLNPYDCRFQWVDENLNGIWDCGIDRLDSFECKLNPPLRSMWMFIPE